MTHVAIEYEASLRDYIGAMRALPRDPRLRGPIARPPINPTSEPLPPDRAIPESGATASDFAVWKEYQDALAEHVASSAQMEEALRSELDAAWSLYWSDIGERLVWLFGGRKGRRALRNVALIDARIDRALRLGVRGRLPMFSVSWATIEADRRHAASRHADLFALVDLELAAQASSNVSAACRAVHRRLSSPRHPQHRLLSYGERGGMMTVASLREQFAKRKRWTPQRQAFALNHAAFLSIRADLRATARRRSAAEQTL